MSPAAVGRIARNFIIFHPTDFSKASEVAFYHALKIALQSRAKLDIMHVEPHLSPEKTEAHWTDFPGVRETLMRWGIVPKGIKPDEVAKTGIRVRKVLSSSLDPLESMLRHFHRSRPDLIVLATHQREGLGRWLHKRVGEPLARRSGAMTLFLPREGKGFVSLRDGSVGLRKILVPVDREPDPQIAVDKASLLVRGLGCVAAAIMLLHVGSLETLPIVELPLRPGWSYETIIRKGEIVGQILKAAAEWKPDLMVLATQGHLDFIDALRGSTTERVLRGARCPILAVPARTRGGS